MSEGLKIQISIHCLHLFWPPAPLKGGQFSVLNQVLNITELFPL